jgi:very-short-patch-repair endonuclease
MHKKPWNYGLNKYNDIRLLRMAEKKMGKVSWNKGLDAKTDFRVEKYAIRIKETKSKTIKGKTYEEIFGIEKAKIRRKQCASWIGRKHTEEEKKKIIESNKNRRITLKTKLKMRKSHVNAISSGKYGYTNTEPHKKIVAAIKQNNMWDGFLEEHPFEWMCIDIANPEIKLAIFVDGDYWHGNSARFPTLNEHQKRRIFIDRSQTSYLEKSGWKVLRFWESEINSNLDDCIAKIRGVKIAQNR